MNTYYELENAVNYGGITESQLTIDPFKIEQSIKLIVEEINLLRTEKTTLECNLMATQAELSILSENYKEALTIIRKMGRDYPELVISTPHIFSEEKEKVI